MSKKAFLFDIDGTLIDSLIKHEEAFYQACSEYNCVINEDLQKELSGKTSNHKSDFLVKKGLIDKISLPWIFERKNELASTLCFENYKPLMQHIDAMHFLHEQLNCKIVLCSNSPRDFVNKFIEKCGFENTIAFSLSGEDIELKKPHPDIYIKALRLLNISPEEAVIFEDSEEGRVAAIRARCHDIVKITNPNEITPSLFQSIIDKFGIRYYTSKYVVHK